MLKAIQYHWYEKREPVIEGMTKVLKLNFAGQCPNRGPASVVFFYTDDPKEGSSEEYLRSLAESYYVDSDNNFKDPWFAEGEEQKELCRKHNDIVEKGLREWWTILGLSTEQQDRRVEVLRKDLA